MFIVIFLPGGLMEGVTRIKKLFRGSKGSPRTQKGLPVEET
jgi:hypothetical protein